MPTSLTDWVLQSRSAGYSPETIDAAFKAKHGFGVLDADPLSPAEAPTLRQDARNRLEAGTGPINPLRSAPAPIPASVDPAIQGATAADLYNHKSRNVIANRVGGGLMAIPASLTGVVKSLPVINPLAAIGGGSPWVNPQAAQGMADAFRAPAQTIAERQGLSPVYEGVQGQVQQTLGSNPAPDVKNDLGAGLSNFETAKAGIHDVWGGVKQLMGQPFGGSIPVQMLEQDPGVQTTQDMWNAQADSMAGIVHGATAGMAGIGANLVTQPAATIGNMPVELASVLAAERMAIAKGAKAVGAEYGTRPGIAGQVARGVGAAGEMADRPLDFATGLVDRAKAKLPSSLTKLNLAMYLDDLVTAGRMQADKAAKLLEKHSPAEFRTYAETPVEQTPTLLQRAVKTAWNAAKGAAIGGEVIGDVPAAILGAAAPEAVRAAFAKLPAETRARLARQFTGSAGQQATPQETAMGEDVVDIGREAHGIEEAGREPAGIVATQDVRLLRPDPSDADAVRKNTVPRPGVTTRPLEVVEGDLVQSPNAGARFMDVAETAKDPRAVELAAKQAATDPEIANPAGQHERDTLPMAQKVAKIHMEENAVDTDKSMLEKSGLQRTAEPDRVPFTTDNATILAHTFEVERMTNKRGGTVPFEQVARLTTDPLLEDSESILRSKRFRGLLLDRAEAMLPGGKRLLDDYLNENVTPTSLGPTPESVTADLGGKRFNLRAEAAKLITELESKPEGQEILRAARAEAIRANFKTARKLYAEQAIGDTLNSEADRFHTTETRGRENSMGEYVDNVARRSIKDTEALPQVTQYDPRQMSAALRGKYGKQADAAAKTLDNQYVPMPANIRKVMNDQRVAAGNEALHGPMWVKKGYLETVRAVAEAHNVLKEFSDFDQKITRGFFHAKKALTALSHGVHLTNMVGNGAFRWMQDGTDPVAQVADYRRVYQDWKHFNEGGDMTPADRRMMRSFAKAGGVETSQLDLDMDAMGMQKSPAQGKASQAWQKYEHAMTKAYSLGDALFKLSQGEKGYKYTMAALGKLGAGESVTLELGRGRAVKVVNEGAGKYRVGKTQLRLDSPELADLVAKHALEKPTRWLVDYSNVPIKMQAARTNILPQALGSVQPFMTWQYTMTDLPGKGGAVKHLLGYDGSMLHTDSPKLLREQAAAAALLGVKRASMIAAATQTGSDARRLASDANAGSKFNPDGANAAERTADPSKLKTWYLDPGNPFGPTEAAWSTLMQFAVDKAGGRPMTQQVDAGKPLKDYGDLTSREKREVQMKIRAEGAQYAAPMDMFNAKTSGAMFGVMKRWADGEKFSLTGAANDAAKLVVGDTLVSLADLAENAAAAVYDPTMVVGSRKTSGTNYADADIEDFAHFFLRRVISNASQDLDPLKRTQESLKAIRNMFDEEVVKPAEMAAGRARKYGTAAQHDERMDKWIRAITVVNGYLAAYGIPEIERAAATIQDDATNLPDSGDEP